MTQSLLGPAHLAHLAQYDWPGNVRELRNHVERCVAYRRSLPLAGGQAPAASPSAGGPPPVDATVAYTLARDGWGARYERTYLEAPRAGHAGNATAAAKTAGLHRIHLHRLMRRAGVRSDRAIS